MDTNAQKDALVLAMLPHAAFDGWSARTMAAAAADLGLDPTVPVRLFPRGPSEAVAHWVALADARMAQAVAAAEPGAGGGVGARVLQAVRLRLAPWAEHREAVRRALSLLSLPGNLGLATQLSWGSADAIWRAVGDASHDLSWYTKRASLAAIHAATLLYWLDDESEGSEDSWAFLRRRLDALRRIPKWREKARSTLGGLRFPSRSIAAGQCRR